MFARPSISAGIRRTATAATRRTLTSTTTRQASSFLRTQSSSSSPLRPSAFSRFPITNNRQQRAWLSDNTRQAIQKAVSSAPVVLFMKGTPELPQCGFSRATIQVLGIQGVDPSKFAAFNVLEDDELRSGIKEFSDWPTIPQLYVDGEFVGGCDILLSMHQDGSLAGMLDDKGVLVSAGGAAGEGEGEGKQ